MPKRRIVREHIFAEADADAMPNEDSTQELLNLLSSLYLSPQYSDLTIICGDEVLSAHQNIVCPRSAYFSRACNGDFKESSGKIELEDRAPILIKKMLQYLYTGDYSLEINGTAIQHEQIKNITANLRNGLSGPKPVFGGPTPAGFSSSFGIHRLEEFENPVKLTKNNVAFQEGLNVLTEANAHSVPHFHALMYVQADYFQIEGLKTKAIRYFGQSFLYEVGRSSFEDMITDIYCSTTQLDQGLRQVAVKLTMKNLEVFRARSILHDGLLKRLPEFAADLCIAMI